jgi:hypothetical protein
MTEPKPDDLSCRLGLIPTQLAWQVVTKICFVRPCKDSCILEPAATADMHFIFFFRVPGKQQPRKCWRLPAMCNVTIFFTAAMDEAYVS